MSVIPDVKKFDRSNQSPKMEASKFSKLVTIFTDTISTLDVKNISAVNQKFVCRYLNDHFDFDWIEVKLSEIHGYGLFATRDISIGSIITMYPPHCVVDIKNKEAVFQNNEFVPDKDYKFNLGMIQLFGDPKQLNFKTQLGHMINDSNCIITNSEDKSELKNLIVRYLLTNQNNAKFINDSDILYIVSTKNIKCGEEILSSYGPMYWLNDKQIDIFRNMIIEDDVFSKFLDRYTDLKIINSSIY